MSQHQFPCSGPCTITRDGDLNIINSARVLTSAYNYTPDDCGLWIVPDPGADAGMLHSIYIPYYVCSLSIECQIDWETMTPAQWEQFLVGEIEELHAVPCGCCSGCWEPCPWDWATFLWGTEWTNFTVDPRWADFLVEPVECCQWCDADVQLHIPYIGGGDGVGLIIVPEPGAPVSTNHYVYVPSDDGLYIVPIRIYPVVSHWNYTPAPDDGFIITDPGALVTRDHFTYIGGADGIGFIIEDLTSAFFQIHYTWVPPATDEFGNANLLIVPEPGAPASYTSVENQYEYIVDIDESLVLINPGSILVTDAPDFVYVPGADGIGLVIGSASDFYYVSEVELVIGGTSLLQIHYNYIPGTTVEIQPVRYDDCGNVLPPDPNYQYDDDALHIQGTLSITTSNWTYMPTCGLIIVPDPGAVIVLHFVYIVGTGPDDTLVLIDPGADVMVIWTYIPGTTVEIQPVLYDDCGNVLPADPNYQYDDDALHIQGTSPVSVSAWNYTPTCPLLIIECHSISPAAIIHYIYIPGTTVEIQPVLDDGCGNILPPDPEYQYDDDALHIQGTTPISVASHWVYVPSSCGLYIVPDATSYPYIFVHYVYWPVLGIDSLIIGGTSPATFTPGDEVSDFVYIPDGGLIIEDLDSAIIAGRFFYIPGTTVEIQPVFDDGCGNTLPLDPEYQYDDDALHIQGTSSPIIVSHWAYVPLPCPPLVLNGTASPTFAYEYMPTGGLRIECQIVSPAEWEEAPPPPEPPEPLIRRYTPIDVLLPTSQVRRNEQYQYAVFQLNTEDPVVPLLYETEIEATMSKMNLEKDVPVATRRMIGLNVRKVVTHRDEIVQVIGR